MRFLSSNNVKMLLIFSGIFFKCIWLSAQGGTIYGHVGEVAIDQTFINRLQFITPDFGFNSNAESFRILLSKNYSLVKAKSDAMKAQAAITDPKVTADLEAIRQLATDKYLAALYDKKQSDSVYTATDADAQLYYNQHIVSFSSPELYSYWLAYVTDTVANASSKTKKQMMEYAAAHKEEFSTGDKSSTYFVYEKDRAVGKNDFYYPILSKMHDGDFSTIPNGTNSFVFIMRTHMTGGGATPFAIVKEQCKISATNEKRARANDEFATAADKKYPVSLNTSLFKQEGQK